MLWIVLAINAVMFLVEFTAGWLASSTALLGDSLDMLGDTLVYGLSLVAVARGSRWIGVSTTAKGVIMVAFGIVVLAEAAHKVVTGTVPHAPVMGAIGGLALAANITCLVLLTRHRGDDVNMRSSWICSRNDLLANAGVLLAAALVAVGAGIWPDVVVGILIAALFLRSAAGVLRDGRDALRNPPPHPGPSRT